MLSRWGVAGLVYGGSIVVVSMGDGGGWLV